MLTIQDVERALPAQLRFNATQEFVDKINAISNDPIVAENIRDNFVTYSSVLKDGKFKTEDYLSAISYVSFKLMGLSNKDSYAKTFPDRWVALKAKNTSDKDISAYVAAYHKNKLVNLILEQSLIPTWLLNQDAYQRAINTQVTLMTEAQSELVRTQAANSILTHLKRPETKVVELQIGEKETSGMAELRATLKQLAEAQLQAIQGGGASAKQIAHLPLADDIEDAQFVQVGGP